MIFKIKVAIERTPTADEIKKRGGDIFMQCYIEASGESFPEKEWSDLANGVIVWWCGAFTEMIKDGKDSCRNPFMDGPYSFICTRKNEHLLITFHKHSNEDFSLLPPISISIDEYKKELLHAAETVIDLTESFGVSPEDHYLNSVKTMRERLLKV